VFNIQIFTDFRNFIHRVLARLHTTPRGLGAAAADTARSAGYFRSYSHYTFCGVTAAVAPNRAL